MFASLVDVQKSMECIYDLQSDDPQLHGAVVYFGIEILHQKAQVDRFMALRMYKYNYRSLPSSSSYSILFLYLEPKQHVRPAMFPGFLQNALTGIDMCRASRVARYSNKCPDDLRDAFFRARLLNTISKTTCLRRETVGGLGLDYKLCILRSWSLLFLLYFTSQQFSKKTH